MKKLTIVFFLLAPPLYPIQTTRLLRITPRTLGHYLRTGKLPHIPSVEEHILKLGTLRITKKEKKIIDHFALGEKHIQEILYRLRFMHSETTFASLLDYLKGIGLTGDNLCDLYCQHNNCTLNLYHALEAIRQKK